MLCHGSLLQISLVLLLSAYSVYSQCEINYSPDTFPSSAKQNLYRGQQTFTLSLLDAINKATPKENIFFSPYSTYHALLLAYFGSRNNTHKELTDALSLTWAKDKSQVYQAYTFEKKMRLQRANDSQVEFSTADKIFLSKNLPFKSCMKNVLFEELENMDFEKNPEESRLRINSWVEELTKNQIKDLLSEGDVSSDTNMILANAAYFKGQWESQFSPDDTKPGIFYISSEDRVFVDMMHKNATYNLGISDALGCYILELPYKAGSASEISMLIFLPPSVTMPGEIDSLEKVLQKLNPDTLKQAINDMDSREIRVTLPKFEFEQRIELLPILTKMGINEVFTNNADLSGFTDEHKLSLGDARHVAKIKVDEEGSTAAAATVLFSFRSARPLEPTEFNCDHPFLFMIYDHKSNAVLFTGIYRDPPKA